MSYATSQGESPNVDARVAEHETDSFERSQRAPGFGWFFSDVVWVEPKDDTSGESDGR